MRSSLLVMGIDLGTSGVRIALINQKKELIHSAQLFYPKGLSTWQDWEECTKELIQGIPKPLRQNIIACAIDGTSGTLLACDAHGSPLGDALPYHLSCPEQKQTLAKILPNGEAASSIDSSLGRALRLRSKYGPKILLRHQADWLTGWFMNNWTWGEEANNFRLGWDPQKKIWPKIFETISLQSSLPLIVESGTLLSKISREKANLLNLSDDLMIISGTTDSNAAVISADLAKNDGLTVLGSTIVVKKFVTKPIKGIGVTNHRIMNQWLCGGATNTGGAVLKKIFSDPILKQLSQQINPELDSGLRLRPMPFRGERFPINDPNLEPILQPRPISDSLYLHGILEGLARIESQCWQKLVDLGANPPKRIITIGGGARNPQWKRIRERITGYPIKTCQKPPAQGTAQIALQAILDKH